MEKQHLDLLLVPLGLLLLVSYHVWLLRLLIRSPTRTVMGVNAISRRFWVQSMMEDPVKNGVLAVQTLRNNIMASTVLASMAIMLSSLIAVLMTNGWGSSAGRVRSHGIVYGDSGDAVLSVKFFSILSCFLLAFLFDVQSIRYYSHASVLINVPVKGHQYRGGGSPEGHGGERLIGTEYVSRALNRGSYFWSLGLRAFYFSFPLFLWVFGPIPMALSCVVMVVLLYFLDINFDEGNESSSRSRRGSVVAAHQEEEEEV